PSSIMWVSRSSSRCRRSKTRYMATGRGGARGGNRGDRARREGIDGATHWVARRASPDGLVFDGTRWQGAIASTSDRCPPAEPLHRPLGGRSAPLESLYGAAHSTSAAWDRPEPTDARIYDRDRHRPLQSAHRARGGLLRKPGNRAAGLPPPGALAPKVPSAKRPR